MDHEAQRGGAIPPIGDYALLGDCRTAALVSRSGSVDWLCLPRFDSPSIFAALLDPDRGGRFAIRPVESHAVERRYLPETNVLETVFRTSTGRVRLVDAMTVASPEARSSRPLPDHELLRMVEGLEGAVELELDFEPRPAYGSAAARVVDQGACGHVCESGAGAMALRSEIPVESVGEERVRGRVRLRARERRFASLASVYGQPAVLPELGEAAVGRLSETERWWRHWSRRCAYDGPHRDAVLRSLLVLKLLSFSPSGAIVAAPTTSLPEAMGGTRNWDYRYCWLRDASLTVRALLDMGHEAEGEAFLAWQLHATRLSWPELQVLYDVYGEARLHEREIHGLSGHGGSRPVRVGNAAGDQLQLDTYGEVVEAAWTTVRRGRRLRSDEARALVRFGETVCRRWREPDEGIWEVRSGPRQHTHSKALCWVALDRLLRLHEEGLVAAPAERFARERDAIGRTIEEAGWNPRLRSYTSVLDGDALDASLLRLGLCGYADPASPRMRATAERVREQLGEGPLLYRYRSEDGLPSGEGAFGITSFWGVELRARQGDVEGASADMDSLCRLGNDVGLFAEEIDPASGAALGNFPQAFTHVGLIGAALALEEALGQRSRASASAPSARTGERR